MAGISSKAIGKLKKPWKDIEHYLKKLINAREKKGKRKKEEEEEN